MTSVLVVDDSRLVRSLVGSTLTEHGYEVGTASDGREAVERVRQCDPDVVTMDVRMPEMDGIDAVEEIMRTDPTPVVMLSAHTAKGAEATIRALAGGAVDFLHKPGTETDVDIDDLESELIATIEAVDGAPTEALMVGTETDEPTSEELPADDDPPADPDPDPDLAEDATGDEEGTDDTGVPTVAIGASTGGPKVVGGILTALPRSLSARVIVVQHMPESFTDRFADHLDDASEYAVTEATDGGTVGPGEAVVAKGDHHLRVTGEDGDRLSVSLDQGERVHSIRPSIDVTMESVAAVASGPLVGVVLTGMGKDGAAGIDAMTDAGATAIVQSEATSPVFSMPQNAIETGAVDHVLAPSTIPDAIREAVGDRQREEAHA
jgi:two-component system chemotaxis response regulator CheB